MIHQSASGALQSVQILLLPFYCLAVERFNQPFFRKKLFSFLKSSRANSQGIAVLRKGDAVCIGNVDQANLLKVSQGAKIRNRYNQVPHLTQDTNGKVTNSQLDTTNESQEVSLFPAGDHKAQMPPLRLCDFLYGDWIYFTHTLSA